MLNFFYATVLCILLRSIRKKSFFFKFHIQKNIDKLPRWQSTRYPIQVPELHCLIMKFFIRLCDKFFFSIYPNEAFFFSSQESTSKLFSSYFNALSFNNFPRNPTKKTLTISPFWSCVSAAFPRWQKIYDNRFVFSLKQTLWYVSQQRDN